MDYAAVLETAWSQHEAPRGPDAPTVVSVFSGMGGSSLGYSMAGYRELMAVDWDEDVTAVFRANFPDVPVFEGDVADLAAERILETTGLRPGELDVLDGSPPCQGFSTAGQRQLDDPRNRLFVEFVRLLRGVRPCAFLIENVGGLVTGKMKLVFAEMMAELKASGYLVRARLMNAMYFQVPQHRRRIIFIGAREDLGVEPSHPKAQHRPITLIEAMPWLKLTGARVIYDTKGQWAKGDFTNKPCPCVITNSHHYLIEHPVEPETDIGDHIIGDEWDKLAPGQSSKKYFNLTKPHPDEPCPCVTTSVNGATGVASVVHPFEKRKFSVAELKIVSSFPLAFKVPATYKNSWKCFGNCVPPLFMRALALHIRREILEKARR